MTEKDLKLNENYPAANCGDYQPAQVEVLISITRFFTGLPNWPAGWQDLVDFHISKIEGNKNKA